MKDSSLFRLREETKVTSTNEIVKQAIDDEVAEGFAIRADEQTGGYGRYDRSWASPHGGLYLSVLLRPAEHIDLVGKLPSSPSTLSLVVGLAVRNALVDVLGDTYPLASMIQVKWPNDVVVADERVHLRFSKLCGISLEQRNGAICIGIGVNVFHPQILDVGSESLEGSLNNDGNSGRNAPAYLVDLIDSEQISNLSIERICDAILDKLEALYEIWLDQGLAPFVESYSSCAYLRGKVVQIAQMDGSIINCGKVLGIDDTGSLLLEKDDGAIEQIVSGEARIALP